MGFIEIGGAFFATLGVFLLSFARGKMFFFAFVSYIFANVLLLIYSGYYHLPFLFTLMLIFLYTAIMGFYNNFNILEIKDVNFFNKQIQVRKIATLGIFLLLSIVLYLTKDYMFVPYENIEQTRLQTFLISVSELITQIDKNPIRLMEFIAASFGALGGFIISTKNPNKILAFLLFLTYDITILIFYILMYVKTEGETGVYLILQTIFALSLNVRGLLIAKKIETEYA